jgi:putative N-acetyltransferase (TIGR04045 family)
MLSLDRICDETPTFVPCDYRVKWADGAWERNEARKLRRAVFCIEQGVFAGDDTDAIDAHAQPLVAVSQVGGQPDQVVGTVRIHTQPDGDEPGLWWGSRLAVHPAFRQQGKLGATLIRLAVSSAHARGASVFLAHVQGQNVPLFRRLHWHLLKEETLHGRPHARMQADLDHYPPCHDPLWGFSTQSRPHSVATPRSPA